MTAKGNLILIGAGGHACVVAEAAALSGWNLMGHVAPNPAHAPALGDWLGNDTVLADLIAQGYQIAVGLGFVDAKGAARRAAILAAIPLRARATIIHPAAIVSPSAQVGAGTFFAAGVIAGTQTHIGADTLLNTGVIVDHHASIAANVHIATGARLAGDITVEADVLIGAGSVIKQGVHIGQGAIIGAGSVVLEDVPAHAVWAGSPAVPIKHKERP